MIELIGVSHCIFKDNYMINLCTQVLEIVAAGPGIGLTKELVKKHSQKAMDILSVFKESDARKALSNIIVAIGDF